MWSRYVYRFWPNQQLVPAIYCHLMILSSTFHCPSLSTSLFISHNSSPLTDGCWSPTRPLVFFTTDSGGILNTWDFALKQTSPTLSVQVSSNSDHRVSLCASSYLFRPITLYENLGQTIN